MYTRLIDTIYLSLVQSTFFMKSPVAQRYEYISGSVRYTKCEWHSSLYVTVGFIRPYRSVKPRRICCCPRQSGQTKKKLQCVFRILFLNNIFFFWVPVVISVVFKEKNFKTDDVNIFVWPPWIGKKTGMTHMKQKCFF